MHVDGLWKLVIPFVLASLAALACGGGGDDDASESPTSSATATVLGASGGESTDVPDEISSCVPQTYEVQSGDTLSQIAETFGVTPVAIAGASRLTDPDFLTVAQELTIPCLDASPDVTEDESSGDATSSPTPEP